MTVKKQFAVIFDIDTSVTDERSHTEMLPNGAHLIRIVGDVEQSSPTGAKGYTAVLMHELGHVLDQEMTSLDVDIENRAWDWGLKVFNETRKYAVGTYKEGR